ARAKEIAKLRRAGPRHLVEEHLVLALQASAYLRVESRKFHRIGGERGYADQVEPLIVEMLDRRTSARQIDDPLCRADGAGGAPQVSSRGRGNQGCVGGCLAEQERKRGRDLVVIEREDAGSVRFGGSVLHDVEKRRTLQDETDDLIDTFPVGSRRVVK